MLEQTIEADKKSVEKVILILLLAYIIATGIQVSYKRKRKIKNSSLFQ